MVELFAPHTGKEPPQRHAGRAHGGGDEPSVDEGQLDRRAVTEVRVGRERLWDSKREAVALLPDMCAHRCLRIYKEDTGCSGAWQGGWSRHRCGDETRARCTARCVGASSPACGSKRFAAMHWPFTPNRRLLTVYGVQLPRGVELDHRHIGRVELRHDLAMFAHRCEMAFERLAHIVQCLGMALAK